MGRVTVQEGGTVAMLLVILLVQGQAEVAAIRFSLASPPDLGRSPRLSEALQDRIDPRSVLFYHKTQMLHGQIFQSADN